MRKTVFAIALLAVSSSGVAMGWMCWTPSRWFGVSTNPPVPGVDASTKLKGDTHSVTRRFNELGQSHLVGLQPLRIYLHLQLSIS